MSEITAERRHFLKLLAALALAAPLGLSRVCFGAAASASGKRLIDVHAHVFNGTDIPAKSFVRIAVLQLFPPQITPKGLIDELIYEYAKEYVKIGFEIVLDGAVLAIVEMINKSAPSPEKEREILVAKMENKGGEAVGRAGSVSGKSVAEQEGETLRELEELMEDYALRRAGDEPKTFFKGEKWDGRMDELDALFDHLGQQSGSKDVTSVPTAEALRDQDIRRDVAKGISLGNSDIFNLMRWGVLLTKYRHEILDAYLSTYGGATRKPVLVAPALVDFSSWLNDKSAADQKLQIELMDILAQISTEVMVHGYTAFDPLREVKAREGKLAATPLGLVKEAVASHGFLGVKLYPPMGFRPIGNATPKTSFPAYVTKAGDTGFGQRLDEVLDELFAWCEQEEVPVLAHAANSQEVFKGYGCRAAPYFWLKVLEKHPNLRLNLAHFGDFTVRDCTEIPYEIPKDRSIWEDEIGQVINDAKLPNVYADLSDFGPAFRSSAARTPADKIVSTKLKKWIETYDPNCTHLLFGTDWSMTQKQRGYEAYIANIERIMRSAGVTDAGLENFFYRNAIRFFGLEDGGRSRERLEDFYKKKGLDLKALANFDPKRTFTR